MLSAVSLNIPFPEHSQYQEMLSHVNKQNTQLVFTPLLTAHVLKHLVIY